MAKRLDLCCNPQMNFMQFLKSLDDLLYELMTWLVFYPITLWRTVRDPWGMMAYADNELGDPDEEQFVDTLSPPLFLLFSLLISHLIELTLIGESRLIRDKHGLAGLINDDSSLLLMRLLVFSIFPLILSVRMVRKAKQKITRDTLRPPFYSQCYPAGLFALLMGLGGVALQLHSRGAQLAGLALMAIAFLWYGALQIRWFALSLHISHLRAFWIASVGMVECVIMIAVLAPFLV